MITKARTGQLKGWSFGFVTTSSEVENRADNIPRRVVTGMKLSEVSLIDGKYTPCYAGTLVEVRAIDNNAEMVEFRADEGIEIVDNSPENEAPAPDYSYYERAMKLLELRYNPYHDPSNGRFCSGGGSGGGGVLVVEKGQKGKGVYVFDRDIDSEYEEWQSSKSTTLTPVTSSDKLYTLLENAKGQNIEYIAAEKLQKPLTTDEIIDKISGGDLTDGSCASLAYAFAANKAGLDVTDYRGGESRKFFSSSNGNTRSLALNYKVGLYDSNISNDGHKSAMDFLDNNVKENEFYIFGAGKHAAIVRKNGGKIEYLELQSENKSENKFHELNTRELKRRFGMKKTSTMYGHKMPNAIALTNISEITKEPGFAEMMGYINTAPGKQRKGDAGHAK